MLEFKEAGDLNRPNGQLGRARGQAIDDIP